MKRVFIIRNVFPGCDQKPGQVRYRILDVPAEIGGQETDGVLADSWYLRQVDSTSELIMGVWLDNWGGAWVKPGETEIHIVNGMDTGGKIEVEVDICNGSAHGTVRFPREWSTDRCLNEISALNPRLRREFGDIDGLSIEISKQTCINNYELGELLVNSIGVQFDIIYGEIIRWWLRYHPDCREVTISGCLV